MQNSISKKILEEKFLLAAAGTAGAAYALEHALVSSSKGVALLFAVALIVAIILAALRVAHHAELLAKRVGEPYGTMILTLASVAVEVVILAIMIAHGASPTLARDTIYSAVMLDINGILGIAALLGGLRHGVQPYNLDSGNTYIVMILTAMGVSMFIPASISAPHWVHYSVFTIVIMGLLYALFLRLQTTKHSLFFSYPYETGAADNHDDDHPVSVRKSVTLLVTGIVLIGVLAEFMSGALDRGLADSGVPPIIVAIIVAAISAFAEIFTAFRSALNNRIQMVVNIALGASLSTVILTVPVVELLALYYGAPMTMGLTPVQTTMTLLTLGAAAINLHDGETNAIEGMTHFVLFATFVMLSVIGM